MSGNITYLFHAVDQPLSAGQRAHIAELSRRVNPTARRADFWYDVDGYDLPVSYQSLLAQYYDVMVRQEYEQWTLAIALPYALALYQSLKPFECEDSEGCGVRVAAMDAKYAPYTKRRVTKPTRVLAEITTFLDYDAVESLEGLREWKWGRAVPDEEDEEADWEEDEWDEGYGDEDALDETLARLMTSIRQDVIQDDLRAFHITWQKFHERRAQADAPVLTRRSKTSPYLRAFKRMLLKSDER